MTNFIPIFPLGLVIFPGEDLNLHIFEPRYKQMITDCFAEQKPFGIPAVINNKVVDTGTLTTITEVSKVYEDGKMDIKTHGQKVFRILEVIKEIPDKLYSGAIVNYPDNQEGVVPEIMQKILTGVRELHRLLDISKDFKKPIAELCSYDIAHHAGLSIEQENELLDLMYEHQRLEYLKRHLSKLLPVVAEMQTLKDRVKLNGHFRNLAGFNT